MDKLKQGHISGLHAVGLVRVGMDETSWAAGAQRLYTGYWTHLFGVGRAQTRCRILIDCGEGCLLAAQAVTDDGWRNLTAAERDDLADSLFNANDAGERPGELGLQPSAVPPDWASPVGDNVLEGEEDSRQLPVVVGDTGDHPVSTARIVATFHPESWTNGASLDTPAVAAGLPIQIDVTVEVLALALEDLHAIEDDSDTANDLIDAGALGHQGPHRVEVVAQIARYFGVDRVDAITHVQHDNARLAEGIEARPVGEAQAY